MGLKSQKVSSLKSILHAYVFTEKKDTDKSGSDSGKFSGNHHNTMGRKLVVPTFLLSSLERAELDLRRTTDSSWPSHVISESYIVSSILNLGFENIFENSILIEQLKKLLDINIRINDLGDNVPEYSFQYINNFSAISIPKFPDSVYSSSKLIQPRVPKHITSRMYDTISRYKLDKDSDGSKIIQLCLMKILHSQTFVRDQHRQTMERCISEIERALQQRVLMLEFMLKNLDDFVREWNKLEKRHK